MPSAQAQVVNATKLDSYCGSIKGLTLYPNPSVNQITINGISQIGNYRIVSMDGKTVAIDNSATNIITVSTLPSGSYIVYFRNGTTNHQLTFTKK